MNDTSPDAQAVYHRRLAQMTPSERVQLGVSLCQAADALQRSALRRLYPDWSDAQITFQIAVSRFGLELATKAYGKQ